MNLLSKVISDAYADVAQGQQFLRWSCDAVRGIKKKAESAVALGQSSFAGEYFLNPELFDLDARPVADISVNLNVSLSILQALITVGGIKQEMARDWLVDVDCIEGDGIGNRILRINALDPANNGIFDSMGQRVSDADEAKELQFCCVKVLTGTLYADTIWAQVLKINTLGRDPILFVQQTDTVRPLAVPILRGVQTVAGDYFDLVGSYGGAVGSAIAIIAAFISKVTTLKATSSPAATIAAADDILDNFENPVGAALKAVEDAIYVIEQLDQQYDHLNMIITSLANAFTVTLPHEVLRVTSLVNYYLQREQSGESDRLVEALQGKARKPHQLVNNLEAGKLRDKHLNNNFVRSGGAPAGNMTGGGGEAGDKIAQAFFDHNAMMEYWAQVGWQAAQKVNKNDPYVRQLEQKLRDVGLEEIVTAHDKAVDNMLNTELNISPPNIVDLDLSPPPKDLT